MNTVRAYSICAATSTNQGRHCTLKADKLGKTEDPWSPRIARHAGVVGYQQKTQRGRAIRSPSWSACKELVSPCGPGR